MNKNFNVGSLSVSIYEDRQKMGKAAADEGITFIQQLLKQKEFINIIFAAAPSQNEVLEALKNSPEVDFSRINAFHMDEYIGLPENAPQGFGNFLKRHLFGLVNFHSVHYINGQAKNYNEECERYALLLKEFPVDICFMGIGENGHIAFNDPAVADFHDSQSMKVVKLDEICRKQQVNDKCFESIENVPTHAFTLTIPSLMNAEKIICTVPAQTKAAAVRRALNEEISETCPASILRTHPNAKLFIDSDAASLL